MKHLHRTLLFALAALIVLPSPAPAAEPPSSQPVATATPTATTASSGAVATPAPTTASSGAVALDQSSPKALLRTFFASRGQIDEPGIRSLLHAITPVEQTALDAVVEVEMANARLRAAEKAKFGHATTAPSSVASGPAAGGLDIEDLEELETFTEKVEGDRAVVSSPMDPKLAMEFVRVGGIWKLPVSSLVGKLDPASGAAIRSATKAQVGIIDAIAADVAAGKLTTEEQVRHELSRRFAERLAEATKASATQAAPTTSPATSPVLGPKT